MTYNCSNYPDLLKALQKNDLKAFDYLFNISRNRLYVLALSIVHNEETAKDLVQEFFIDFWLNKMYNNILTSINAYLFQAVRNRAFKYLEKEKTITRLKKQFVVPLFAETCYPLENSELKRDIDNAVNALPPMAGKVFKMQYMENLTHVQIANILGISRHTVSSHIDRALKELRGKLIKNL